MVLVYVDASHCHRDWDLGDTWGRVGRRLWRASCCALLSDRSNWYGAYHFTDGRCFIGNAGHCTKEHTTEFLERLYVWATAAGRELVVIWDNAPGHTANRVKEAAAALGIELVYLPSYRPDLNPIEGLWKWLREEVTQLTSYASLRDLFDACKAFIDEINRDPLGIINRLWPRFELDPEVEKLRFSH